eukprot:GHVN01051205.1.p1 GENE.GHVN01051205.1~~GHVN01051205.1.p1  ORF type:complete len:359 (+),score=29.29 GHVN01051205.1:257-1333(+)
MQHSEGGWPSELDSSDCYLAARNLWRRKAADRSIFFQETLRMLCSETLKVFREDALENLFEDYFGPPISGGGTNITGVNGQNVNGFRLFQDPPSVSLATRLSKGENEEAENHPCQSNDRYEFVRSAHQEIGVLNRGTFINSDRDQHVANREASLNSQTIRSVGAVTSACWSPEAPQQLAASYSATLKTGLIWDVRHRCQPLLELNSTSVITSLQYNPASVGIVAGGCKNGTVAIWDLRKGGNAAFASLVEVSHFDAACAVSWVQSKTNSEFVSVSSDGTVRWWDWRHAAIPIALCELNLDHERDTQARSVDHGHEQKATTGGLCVEWSLEAGASKLLVGTDCGKILSITKKAKKSKCL